MIRYPILSVLLILLLPLFTFAQHAANQFRRVDIGHGLSNNQVNAIFSDSKGFMWFATISGLNRFDGQDFRIFKYNPDDPHSLPENTIHHIYEDHIGMLWLFAASGEFYIYNPITESFSAHHCIFDKPNPPSRDSISSIKTCPGGNLWITYFQHGIAHYNVARDEITHLRYVYGDPGSLSSNQIMDIAFSTSGMAYAITQEGVINAIDIESLNVVSKIIYAKGGLVRSSDREYRIYADRDGHIWLYSVNAGDGVYMIDQDTGITINMTHRSPSLRLSHSNISSLLEDNRGRIWIGTEHGGINIIDKSHQTVTVLSNIPGDLSSLSGNSITSLYKSKGGIIWVGTFKNGINLYYDHQFQFPLYRSLPTQEGQFFSNDVNCFAEDSKGNLWIGTNGDGLVYYDRQNNTFINYRHNPDDPNSLSSNVIVSLFVDYDDRLWIGTYLGGLNLFDGRRFRHFRHNPEVHSSLADDRVWQILRDTEGRLWVGTLGGGLDLYDERKDGFIHHPSGAYNSLSSDYVLSLYEDSEGNIWIGTNLGLNKLDASTGRFQHFVNDPGNPTSISNNNVLSVLEDTHGNIWLGTRNGLNLLDRTTKKFRVFREADGLPDHNIISLQMDNRGNLWIATLNGISKMSFDASYQDFVFHNFDESDGLQGREFNIHSSLKTTRGEIIFGGANGFNIFYPNEIINPQQYYRVKFTDFRLFNRKVGIGETVDGKVLLPVSMANLSEITLRYNQNVFTVEFSALNFFNPERTRYRYMLEGFNTEWLETDVENSSATYTNLDPGKYIFRVAAQSSDGSWGEESQMAIVVVPPFYATIWAFGFYFLVIVASVILFVRLIKRREKLKFTRRQEKEEFNRMRDLDAMKTKFFTNVSHEFRTPLTMILTPVEKLLKEDGDEKLKMQLNMIQRNGRRLLCLVNQLLDFRKMEVSKINLKLSYEDIIYLLKESFASFTDLFICKNITYEFTSNIDQYNAHYDGEKIERIIFNLLSNAVKFTPENGKIGMIVNQFKVGGQGFYDTFSGREYLEIKVIDTGIGIAHDRQKKVFERFFQSDDHEFVINQGSGIGLSLALEYVNMHQGVIHVESEPGKGSCFTVQLPLDTNAPVEAEKHEDVVVQEIQTQEPGEVETKEALKEGSKPLVLIVEDNDDLRFYLKENLRGNYNILEAANGKTGWEVTRTRTPHLVVTDIMMPLEGGLSLCRKIKADTRTSHIPVILLTARTSTEQKMEGLKAGAEDYITKPFNYELLQLKIRRLIDLRLAFQKTFARKFEIKPGEIGITSLDEKFLAKSLKVAEENIGNPDFSVEKMGRELGVSRGHLYNKLVALTGKTPVEFIRIMRLKRAAQFLGKSQLTVSEIAYQVGFNDPKYFTKYFKEEYGMVPSEYARKNM